MEYATRELHQGDYYHGSIIFKLMFGGAFTATWGLVGLWALKNFFFLLPISAQTRRGDQGKTKKLASVTQRAIKTGVFGKIEAEKRHTNDEQ